MIVASRPQLSFEFFPPKTDVGVEKLDVVAQKLNSLKPDYFSVTFGAGGSTANGTFDTVHRLQKLLSVSIAPHISCLCHSKAEIVELLQRYQAIGVKKLVVLRGDAPVDDPSAVVGELSYANELVAFVREQSQDFFHIEVAAYPEFHPEAVSADADLGCFKQKVLAGADGAITQYFYSIEAYRRFVDFCDKQKLSIPVIPGIMPITDYERLLRFSKMCGAEVPQWLRGRLACLADDAQAVVDFGREVVLELCQQLLAEGVPGLHFYTLNQAEPSFSIAQQLFSDS